MFTKLMIYLMDESVDSSKLFGIMIMNIVVIVIICIVAALTKMEPQDVVFFAIIGAAQSWASINHYNSGTAKISRRKDFAANLLAVVMIVISWSVPNIVFLGFIFLK